MGDLKTLKKFLFLILCMCIQSLLNAQIWQEKQRSDIEITGLIDINPNTAKSYFVNDDDLRTLLWTSPKEEDVAPKASTNIITVPMANGEFDQFRIVEYQMMEEALARKYPNIKTFHGVSVTKPHRRIRASYTQRGFRGVIMDEQGNSYIDHFQRGDKNHKLVYYKKDIDNINLQSWSCDFESVNEDNREEQNHGTDRAGDCIFRSYRLALATTAEYSNFHGATSATQSGLVMDAVVEVMNRVNGVLEQDVTIRFILVANTDLIFYYNAGSDPYSNGNGSAMLGQNQTTCNNVIGSGNYDIGHVFSTGGGGVAYLGCICNNSNKAGGVTGQANPVGDPFSIDYVAHEMGHQLGGNHTQFNSCNRNNATATEPGSASSIMGYAGICNPDVQPHSDAYYHAVNILEIKNEIQSNSCHAVIPFTNAQPSMAALSSYSIPKSTPFFITASATDGDGDPLTYCWEQVTSYAAGNPQPPVSTNTGGPMFRSLTPVSSPTRYFPPLADVLLGNTSNTWEVVPSVARSLNLRATVRDYHSIAGCTDEENMVVTIVNTSGAFNITSHNTASSVEEGQVVAVTWNVSGTTAAPINCANVNIFLSYDGGLTYPVTLAADTPNDGSESITIPIGLSTTARIMVKASNNIFYDVNNANITITAGSQPSFNLTVNPSTLSVCHLNPANFTITIAPLFGFNQPVTLSAQNLPSGVVSSFSVNPLMPNASSVLTLTNLNSLNGTYLFKVNGTYGSIVKQQDITLTVIGGLAAPVLSAPANGTTNEVHFPTLQWNAVPGALSYTYELALNNTFSYLAHSGTTTSLSTIPGEHLIGSATYYWRVRANNECSTNPWSSVFSFTINPCFYYKSTDVPKTISASIPNTIVSQLQIYDRGAFSNLEITNLEGSHSFVDNLKFSVISPNNIEVLIWDRPCNNDDNFDINLNSLAPNTNYPCPPVDGLTYKPTNPNALTAFNNFDIYGSWRLKIEDLVANDGGSLNRWGAIGCSNKFCKLYVEQPLVSGVGSLNDALSCAVDGDTIRFSPVLINQEIDLGANNILINKNLVFIADPSLNIAIKSTSNNPTVQISSGINATIEGLKIKASLATTSIVENGGNLIFKNVSLLKNPGISLNSLYKNNGSVATLSINGQCNLEE